MLPQCPCLSYGATSRDVEDKVAPEEGGVECKGELLMDVQAEGGVVEGEVCPCVKL